jgi:very-short-patch-repair endonuclease
METRLRVGLIQSGAPLPEVQYRVLDAHGFMLARADLAYPPARLAIEYDGAAHLDRRRWIRDRDRDAALADVGWETLRLGHDDVVEAMRQTTHRVIRLLNQRAPTVYDRLVVDATRLDG